MSKPRVLFVDDELFPNQKEPRGAYMWYYVKALHDARFHVSEVTGADEALALLAAPSSMFDVIIIDIMMPPGNTFGAQETRNGMHTGILLAKMIRSLYPQLLMVVLTNVLTPLAMQRLAGEAGLKRDRILSKDDHTPVNVAGTIAALLEKNHA